MSQPIIQFKINFKSDFQFRDTVTKISNNYTMNNKGRQKFGHSIIG